MIVLVAGPAAARDKYARYHVLSIILQHLALHELDVLLDDFGRQDESETLKRRVIYLKYALSRVRKQIYYI